MGCIILTDREHRRALLFDTVSETALDHPAFSGADATEQAESFIGWLDEKAHGSDARQFPADALRRLRDEWADECIDEANDDLSVKGWAYRDRVL